MERMIAYERSIGKFKPLNRVITHDDFDNGFNGWMDLTPNFVYPDYRSAPSYVDLDHWAPTMISQAPMRFAASHGSMEGTYSLKLNTKPTAAPYTQPPAPGSMGVAIKRLSQISSVEKIQIEAWYAYTPQQDREGIGEDSIRAFGVFFDMQDAEYRFMPGVRYVNSVDGDLVKRWQYWRASEGVTREEWCFGLADGWQEPGIDNLWYGRRYSDGSSDAFQWIPDGKQELLYNESPDKINWLYLRLSFDCIRREYIELESVNKTFNLRGLGPTLATRYDAIDNLINPIFFVEADTNQSVNLFLDSVVYSVE